MTLETLIFSVGVLAALQAGYVFLRNMEAKPAQGPAVWSTGEDAFSMFEQSKTDRAAGRMKKDFDLARAKSIMGVVAQFGEKKIEL